MNTRAVYLCPLLNARTQSISSSRQLLHGGPYERISHRTFLLRHVTHALELLFFPLLLEIGSWVTWGLCEGVCVGAGAGDEVGENGKGEEVALWDMIAERSNPSSSIALN
jgi:hypothetical protein